MRTNISYHKCTEAEIARVPKHWAGKEALLDPLLGSESPDETRLDLRVQCEPESNRYAVRAILPLPAATLTAEARDENVLAALDRVAELLAEEVRLPRSGALREAELIDVVEEASAESFPASDAPAWIHITV